MSYNYAVIGAGRQGTAAAYDMARWGDAKQVILADRDQNAAKAAVKRVNGLLDRDVAVPRVVNVQDHESLMKTLQGVDAFLSAVPYYYNMEIAKVAVEVGASMCDLGGHTGIARQQHALEAAAREKGVSLIPNCGQVPGEGTTLIVYAIELLDEAVDVFMWDGGLSQEPRQPFNYLLTFNVEGLTNEYAEAPTYIQDRKVVEAEPMTDLEIVEFPVPFGRLEAFTTGGGLDTLPWTYEGTLRTLVNKTLRYPGHFAQLRAFYDLGLWDLDPIDIKGTKVVPRDVFHTLFEPKVTRPDEKDAILIRVKVVGKKDGRDAEAIVELVDLYDEETGFTAMEKNTGWSAAIVTEMAAQGKTLKGAGGVEVMVPAKPFVDALTLRGIRVQESVKFL